jgi:endonuclease/exonuclease/phosphatase family metal-dependent hydrolase
MLAAGLFLGVPPLAVTAALLPATPAPTMAGSELRVMTFNLRYASATPPNTWAERRPAMRQLLQEQAPDVVGTQEGLYQQIKDLETDLPTHGWIGLGREGGSRGEFMAVFYRKDRLEPLEFDHFWLSDTPEVVGSRTWGNKVRRMVTWVRFRDQRTGHEFFFWNTHFDHEVQAAREKSAALVLQRVRDLQTTLPVILVGDFNSAAGANAAYDVLVSSVPGTAFVDTWTTAAQRGPEIGTFHGYREPARPGTRIDWILTRGPVTTLFTEVVTFARNGQYPSDHFPVMARLKLLPPAEITESSR